MIHKIANNLVAGSRRTCALQVRAAAATMIKEETETPLKLGYTMPGPFSSFKSQNLLRSE